MDLPTLNYERMNRLKQAEVPLPTKWDMTWATKCCLGMILIGLLILFKRRINKNDRNAYAQAKANIF